jgi:hypothetical protein
MPSIFDFLYREYCRARLAEMRKQLLISADSHEVPTNCDHLNKSSSFPVHSRRSTYAREFCLIPEIRFGSKIPAITARRRR